jgi:glycosyltransferase involved in cell wall biosynthesis
VALREDLRVIMSERPRPRIGLNALSLQPNGTGAQVNARELLRVLPDHVKADLVAAVRSDVLDEVPATIEYMIRPPARGFSRYLAGARTIPDIDLYHGLEVHLPLRPKAPTLASIHDLSVIDMPETFPRDRRIGERLALEHTMRRADNLTALSQFTADRVHSRFGRMPTVIYLAPDPSVVPPTPAEVESVRQTYSLPERFVLFVGSLSPRKDITTLAAGCQAAGIPLVHAGPPGMTATPSGVIELGYVDKKNLPALYGSATVLGYTCLYEGFGLPPLEAMVCGCPVLGFKIPVLVEVLGEAAVLVKPGDVDDTTEALRHLLADESERLALVEAGRVQAAKYSWARAAEETAAVYREMGLDC